LFAKTPVYDREEQTARRNIESAIKVSNELIQHLGSRIKEAEQKLVSLP
jgi:hypothetical protein